MRTEIAENGMREAKGRALEGALDDFDSGR